MFQNSPFRSPRPDRDVEASPASQTVSRFRFSGIRSMANGSSVYSQSPALTSANTPKMPMLGFLRRPHEPNLSDVQDVSTHSSVTGSPPLAQHSARSYIGTITPPPRAPESVYSRHPADVPLPMANEPMPRQNSMPDPETEQLSAEVNGQRRQRRRRRRRHPQADHWKRKRGERRALMPFVRGSAARGKLLASIISGSGMLGVLTIYLAIALSNKDIGQEIHILFILVLLSITIFFCHSLIRLCMLILNPPREIERNFMPNMTAQEGFQPVVPIPVRLARDDELELGPDSDSENDMADPSDPEKDVLPPPPPAYGLWRSSVRADPNLLHWQRADERNSRAASRAPSNRAPSAIASRNGSAIAVSAYDEPENQHGPRPPSYVSEDGVSYITEAVPRSTAGGHSGVSDIHPAWRPGYAMSAIGPGELPPRV